MTVGIPDQLKGSVPQTLIATLPRRMIVVWTQEQVVVETSINNPNTHKWTAYPSGFFLAWGCNLRAQIFHANTTGAFTYQMPHPTCGGSASGDKKYGQLVNLQAGKIYGQRGSGTPVNCAPMPSCYTYEGYTTWQVYPSATVLKVTASPSSVIVGDSVTFTASRTDPYPFAGVERWIWVPKDSTQPPRTVACAVTAATNKTCRTAVYEDGWMFAQAEIDALQTAPAGVNVTDEAIVRCRSVADTNSHSVMRGSPVRCTARLRSGRAFTVTQARVAFDTIGTDTSETIGSSNTSGGMSADNTTWTSQGQAAITTVLRIRWKSGHEAGESTDGFDVTPRPDFPDPQFPKPTTYELINMGHVMGEATQFGKMLYGAVDRSGLSFGVDPAALAGAIVPVTEGPNQGLSFLANVPLRSPNIFVNNVFVTTSAPWYTDQNGVAGPAGAPTYVDSSRDNYRWCNEADIPSFIPYVLEHEGYNLSANSHVGLWNIILDQNNKGEDFESIVFRTSHGTARLRMKLRAMLRRIADAEFKPMDDALEVSEGRNRHLRLGCADDLNPFDQ